VLKASLARKGKLISNQRVSSLTEYNNILLVSPFVRSKYEIHRFLRSKKDWGLHAFNMSDSYGRLAKKFRLSYPGPTAEIMVLDNYMFTVSYYVMKYDSSALGHSKHVYRLNGFNASLLASQFPKNTVLLNYNVILSVTTETIYFADQYHHYAKYMVPNLVTFHQFCGKHIVEVKREASGIMCVLTHKDYRYAYDPVTDFIFAGPGGEGQWYQFYQNPYKFGNRAIAYKRYRDRNPVKHTIFKRTIDIMAVSFTRTGEMFLFYLHCQ
jgi:hypothetical protein